MLIELIDKFLEKHYETRDDDRDETVFHPSYSKKCQRAIYYNLIGKKKGKISAKSARIFSMGDAIHDRWQSFFDKMGIQIKKEQYVEFTNGYISIKGSIDSICIIDNQLYIIEIKSIRSYGFGLLDEPQEEHISQVQLYMYLTKVYDAIVFYENKDTCEIKEFHVKYDSDYVKKILNKFCKIKSCVDDRCSPPDREFQWNSWQCRWCSFKSICREE